MMTEDLATWSAKRTAEEVEDVLQEARPWLYRLALSIVGSADAAEDIAQNTLLRAARSRRKLRQVDDLRAWLRRVLVRCAMDELKRRKNEALSDFPQESDPTSSLAVRQVLARLAPGDRAMLALAHFDGLSYEEIAQALEIPVGTVGSRLHSAREAFRREWNR
jgi:RNA polymerase sigma-70 factor, ECF subfamily